MHTIQIRPNKTRGITVLILLSLMFILQLWMTIQEQIVGAEIVKNFTPSSSKLFYLDAQLFILNNLVTIIYIAAIIYYVRWFRRAYFNLNSYASPLRYRNGWAAGSWFIPVFHWIGPIQIMLELYRKTRKFLMEKNISVPGKWIYIFVALWWGMYFMSGVSLIYSFFIEPEDLTTIEAFALKTKDRLTFNILQSILTFLAIVVVYMYYKMERFIETIPEIKLSKHKDNSNGILDSTDAVGNVVDVFQ